MLTLSALGATVAAAIWFLILPLAKTVTLTGIARAIEEHHPELQERLSSAIELLTSRDMPSIRGSETLIAALAQEATIDAVKVQPQAEITLRSARPFLIAAGSVLVILLALVARLSGQCRAAASSGPWRRTANMPSIRADMITVKPGDIVMKEGDRLQVDVTVASKAASQSEFRRVLSDGSESLEMMSPLAAAENGDLRFSLLSAPAADSFRYRIHVGDALTRYYNVTVVPPPAVKRMEIRYDYPAYTKWEPYP